VKLDGADAPSVSHLTLDRWKRPRCGPAQRVFLYTAVRERVRRIRIPDAIAYSGGTLPTPTNAFGRVAALGAHVIHTGADYDQVADIQGRGQKGYRRLESVGRHREDRRLVADLRGNLPPGRTSAARRDKVRGLERLAETPAAPAELLASGEDHVSRWSGFPGRR